MFFYTGAQNIFFLSFRRVSFYPPVWPQFPVIEVGFPQAARHKARGQVVFLKASLKSPAQQQPRPVLHIGIPHPYPPPYFL